MVVAILGRRIVMVGRKRSLNCGVRLQVVEWLLYAPRGHESSPGAMIYIEQLQSRYDQSEVAAKAMLN